MSKTGDAKQSKRFIDKARELGADGDVSMAEIILKRLAKTPPKLHKSKGK